MSRARHEAMMKEIRVSTVARESAAYMDALRPTGEMPVVPKRLSNLTMEESIRTESDKRAHNIVIREEALKIYLPIRKVAVVIVSLLVGTLIAGIFYMVGYALYELWLNAPLAIFIIAGAVLLTFLVIMLSNNKDCPPFWTIKLVEWRLNRHMKKAIKVAEEHEVALEQEEAEKIENQLL